MRGPWQLPELFVGTVSVAAIELGIVVHISAGWLDELAGGVRGETRCHTPGVIRGDYWKNKTKTSLLTQSVRAGR